MKRLAERREDELADRARRRADAEADGAHVVRQEPRERRGHQQERRARDAEADQHTPRELQDQRVARLRHQREAERIEHRAAGQHPRRAVAVGEHADERLRHPPGKVLDGDGEGEHLAPPAELGGHGRQEEAHGRARPERDDRDQAAGEEHQRSGRDAGRAVGFGHGATLARLPPAEFMKSGDRRHRPDSSVSGFEFCSRHAYICGDRLWPVFSGQIYAQLEHISQGADGAGE